MAIMGGQPPPIPPEVLAEERDKIRQQLDLERSKSRLLYERAYQGYLLGQTEQRGKGRPAAAASESDMMSRIKKAYADAIELRAFRDVMEDTMDHGATPAAETLPGNDNLMTNLMRSGVDPRIVNQWLKSLDPEALGALIAFSSQNQNPALSQMAYAMSQRGQKQEGLTIKDIIELNTALSKTTGQPNISIDLPKLIESVKAAPATASPSEIMETTLKAITTGMAMVSGGKSEKSEPKGVLEGLLSTPDGVKIAKEAGLIGGDTNMMNIVAEMRKNDQAFQAQQVEMDRRFQLRLEAMHAETSLKKRQIIESRRRTDMIGGALQRIGKAVADGFAEGGGEEGKAAHGQVSEKSMLQTYTCECGAPIIVPPNVKPGESVKCAKCGAVYDVTPQEPTK